MEVNKLGLTVRNESDAICVLGQRAVGTLSMERTLLSLLFLSPQLNQGT